MASAGSPPKAPDPATVIAAQEQANRYNTQNPFGSTSWADNGPGGHATQTTQLSPQMQAMMDQAFSSASSPRTQMSDPFGGGMSQLASAIMGNVGKRYGLQGDQFHSTAAGKGGQAPPTPLGAMPGGMPNMPGSPQGGMPGQPQQMGLDPSANLRMQPGVGGGQMGGLASLMSAPGGGYGGGTNPLQALQAMQGQGMPQMPQNQQGGQMGQQQMFGG